MPSTPSQSQWKFAWKQQSQELLISTPADFLVPALARAHSSQLIWLPATTMLVSAVYVLAVGGSMLLAIRAPVLDGVPLSFGPAAFFYFCSRIVFPRSTRIAATHRGNLRNYRPRSERCLPQLSRRDDWSASARRGNDLD